MGWNLLVGHDIHLLSHKWHFTKLLLCLARLSIIAQNIYIFMIHRYFICTYIFVSGEV